MSIWSYVIGTIRVEPKGRTQAEKTYILDTVLNHLPLVSGSEEPMYVMTNIVPSETESSSDDEFMQRSNLWKYHAERGHGFRMCGDYMVTVQGYLKDVELEEAAEMVKKWLKRLSKRIRIEDLVIQVSCPYDGYQPVIFNDVDYFKNRYELEDNWCDFLMWDWERNEQGDILVGKPSKHSAESEPEITPESKDPEEHKEANPSKF